MQQTFYIDNDEEISSVIDKLKKSLAKDNYFVVPRRAIFLQSIVNLKLLKREADKLKKKVIIVTQDELGMNMAEKAGVEVRSSFDGVEQEISEDESPISYARPVNVEEQDIHVDYPDKKVRLKEVGSDDFYGGRTTSSLHATGQRKKNQEKELPKATELPRNEISKRIPIAHSSTPGHGRTMDARQMPQRSNSLMTSNLDPQKEKQLERMFEKPKDEKSQQVPMGKKTKKIFLAFFLLCCVAFMGVAAFLFLPKASITVTTFLEKKKVDVDLSGKTDASSVEIEDAVIPIRIIESQQNLTLSYDASGQGEGSGQKAKGNITIYNNFNNSSQQLVATTRFESKDGKIFRLAKSVVVSGQTVVNGETKPGAIEAEVIADESGEGYNIEPTEFKIPGFKDSPKYDKFSATSTKAMTGGGVSTGNTVKVISQRDIDVAKKDVEAKLKEKIKNDLEGQLKEDEVLLDDAVKYVNGQMMAFGKIGDKKNSFDYSANGTGSAMVFSKNDIEKVVEGKYLKSDKESILPIKSMRLDYAGITPDFDKKTLSMRLHSELTLNNPLSADGFKKELLGKNEQQIEQLIQKYPSIKNVTFEFQPSFISRVPQYEQRVDVFVKAEEE